MLTSRVLLRRHASYLKWNCISNRGLSQAAEEPDDLTINLDVRLARLPKKKPQREPFAKNFFIGKFDNEIMAFPEIQTNERQNQFENWLAPIEECVNRNFDPKETDENILSLEGIEQLKELGVFRASISEEDKGIGLTATENARLVEILGKNPSLAAYFASRTDPVAILLKYGNEEQKNRYLPRFVSGELIPTFAILEDAQKENLNTENTSLLGLSATGTQCRKYWKLNGEKIYVPNGNQANCFILLANCTETDDPLHKPEAPTMFIVEREHGGISSSKTAEKLGQRGLETCSVQFKDTLIPRENVIGKLGSGPTILLDLLTLGKQNVGSRAAAILRRLIDVLAKYAIEKKYYDKQLMNVDSVQEIIGKMVTSLYAIESMTYLTTGLMDQFQDQDCEVENAIVEAYSAKECVAQVHQGLQIVGKESYLGNSIYQRIYRDALALSMFDGSETDLHTYIGVMGLRHSGTINSERVKKYRNPLMFPKFILNEVFASKKGPDLAIEEHLHPSLQISARLLQEAVHMLDESTATMLVNHGTKVIEVYMELRRLADMAIQIYTMSAALARASRSYCIGLRHSKEEIVIAHTICFTAYHKVKINYTEIEAGDTQNCDDTHRTVARRVFQQKGYFAEHPLKKNF